MGGTGLDCVYALEAPEALCSKTGMCTTPYLVTYY
jgi:hypothetical protein